MESGNSSKNKIVAIIGLFFALVFFLGWQTADAATLTMHASDTTVSPGQTITLGVTVNSQGVAINDAAGTIHFPSSLLSVLSVSKSSSVFSIWVEEPSYSNASGTVTFEGGVPTPGFTGTGNVIYVTLQAKAAGDANITFSDAAVRANDGNGTDVLSGQQGTSLSIAQNTTPPPATVTPPPATTTKAPATTKPTKNTVTTPVVETPVTQTVQVPSAPEVVPQPVPAVNAPSFWSKVRDIAVFRSLQSFALNGISGLLIILLLILLAIVGTYLWLRLRGKLKRDDDIISDEDGLKMLNGLRKRLEKHLTILQDIRHARILNRAEKKMKEDIEADLDDVDKAIAKIKR